MLSIDDQIRMIIVNGLFAIGGVILGAVIPFIKDIIELKQTSTIERIRLHDANKLDAYRKLYSYCRDLRMVNWPDSLGKDLVFLNKCSKTLFESIENMPYFSENIRCNLLKIAKMFDGVILNFEKKETNCKIIEQELPQIISTLNDDLLEAFNKWGSL